MPEPQAVSRRTALGLLAALAASPSAVSSARAGVPVVPSLGEIAARRGILFGTAFDAGVMTNPAMAAHTIHHARILTSDNFMKFGSLRPVEGPADFALADRLVAFCATHNIPLRGHNLIWNDWTPDWVGKLSPSRCAYWLDRHIDEVVSRYAGRLHSWDVVNEPFWPGHGQPGGFRNGPWFAAMGMDTSSPP